MPYCSRIRRRVESMTIVAILYSVTHGGAGQTTPLAATLGPENACGVQMQPDRLQITNSSTLKSIAVNARHDLSVPHSAFNSARSPPTPRCENRSPPMPARCGRPCHFQGDGLRPQIAKSPSPIRLPVKVPGRFISGDLMASNHRSYPLKLCPGPLQPLLHR